MILKILLFTVFGIVGLIAFLLIIGLFITKDYVIEKTITINKSKQDVFSFIKNLKNQDYYNHWIKSDPNIKKDFRGTDGTVGFVYAWDSKKAGVGEQEIKKILEGEKIEMEMRFIKPFPSTSVAYFLTEGSGNQTKMTWGMSGINPYPHNVMYVLFLKNLLGKNMESGLTDLKSILEKK